MGLFHSPRLVTGGLVLCLDAANPKSYPGSGTAWTDLSGNGNTGTLTNGPTYSSANGGSIVFDGTNDYAEINSPTTLRNQNFTISTWVNLGIQNNSIISILDFDHASPTFLQGWVLQSEDATTNRNFYFAWYDGSVFQPSTGIGSGKGITIPTSSFQNIVYTKNGTLLLGYLNGIQVYTITAGNSNVSYLSNRNFRIATSVTSSVRSFKGNISNTLIYNRALTASEVQQNFNALRGRYGV